MSNSLLIIGSVWPEPKSSAAGSRMMQLIDVFRSNNFNITFATACGPSENASDLSAFGIDVVAIELNSSTFDDFIQRLNPDLVLFDRFMTEEQFGWRVASHCPRAIRILDTEDLHCLRKGRQEALKNKVDFDTSFLFNETAKREIASIYRCDLSLIISEFEMELLTQVFKISPSLLYYIPFILEPLSRSAQDELPGFNSREHFITIGNFLHEPNVQSVVYLKQHLWPLIRKQLPKSQLHVYGAYGSQKVKQLNNEKEGFFIKGFVDDVNSVMQQSKICLAPLKFGAGLKGKLIDAMRNGTPCVMSSIASEGMFGDLPANGFIADSAADLVNSAVALYRNETLWNETQQNGFNIINSRFQRSHFESDFTQLLSDLRTILKVHRQENFIGEMLQHHTLQSTKYLSKWIEEKNK